MDSNNASYPLGLQWVQGTAAATRFPTNGQGGATATASASQLVNAKAVQIVGILVSVGAAVAVNACDNSSAAIPGLTLTAVAATPGYYAFGDDGVIYTGGNVGITCGAGLTATLFYRLLT